MFQAFKRVRPKPPKLSKKQDRVWHRRLVLAITLTLGMGIVEPALNPPAAEAACFFWQACARRRGQATNTRAGGKRTGRIIGGNDATIPYVISPRNAWIREPSLNHPYTIRWNLVEGVNSYTVRLWRWTFERDQPDQTLWQLTVTDTNQISFPRQVSLEPGDYYSIEIVTDTGISSNLDDGYYQSGFQLLFEEDYEVLRSQLTEVTPIVAADATPTAGEIIEEAALATAGVFFLEEMYADALAVLQPLTEHSTASNLVYTALGDTYSQSGLNQLAIAAYEQALKLATDSSNYDLLSEAIIRVNLADVYATLGLFDNALEELRDARKAYEKLQEETEIARLDRRIQIIDSRLLRQSETESTP
ncbi:MAG: tetratricopeptide repeat protein [Cyanobacteria bacterium P01_F01_bin.13]